MGWRCRIDLEYDGTDFSGWQVQPGRRTVQGELAGALARLGETARPTGSGRTDAGVHALQNPCHVDLERGWEPGDLAAALAALTPADLRIRGATRVGPEFHARFDAVERTYLYALGREASVFFRNRRFRPRRFPDPGWAAGELAALVGVRDFAGFARSGAETRTTVCAVTEASWLEREGGALIRLTADRFLYGMVRAVVGTLVREFETGAAAGGLRRVIEGRDRSGAGPAAPPGGLYLAAVGYPGERVEAPVSRAAGLAGLGESVAAGPRGTADATRGTP
jgi:tRNA pseudouridine38-40 synthase